MIGCNRIKQSARLIIPAWGDIYVRKLTSVTLPAVLAAGNLPALCEDFDVELIIVTESRLFQSIRNSLAYLAVQKICPVTLIPLDDLMTSRSIDYGMLLTYALFRGFSDLGERMTKTYLLFLNTDFIVCDGSLRHLGELMQEGKRVIHAPSFRVVLEKVWPELETRVDAGSTSLALQPREMAKLALANKHRTVQARTVNQRFCHQIYQDQFYWYVDDETLIGYQWPVALVAIRPERMVREPVMFWDFGFLPEAAPSEKAHFICDSDSFFMIELQARNSGQNGIRLGAASIDEIAGTLALYATKEHRQSGQQLLTIHSGDLPANLQGAAEESRAYMAEVIRRMPPPVPHIDHPRLGLWFEQTRRQQKSRGIIGSGRVAFDRLGFTVSILFNLQRLHRHLCGAPPKVNRFHPLWLELHPVVTKIEKWRKSNRRILWVGSGESALGALLEQRVSPSALMMPRVNASVDETDTYDACICELSLSEVLRLRPLYERLRLMIKDEGEIVVSITTHKSVFDGAATLLEEAEYPEVDVSKVRFCGTAVTALVRKFAAPGLRPIATRAVLRGLIVAFLIIGAPLVGLANTFAIQRNCARFSQTWTSALIEFAIRRRRAR